MTSITRGWAEVDGAGVAVSADETEVDFAFGGN